MYAEHGFTTRGEILQLTALYALSEENNQSVLKISLIKV